jgi:Superinfection immunity protein
MLRPWFFIYLYSSWPSTITAVDSRVPSLLAADEEISSYSYLWTFTPAFDLLHRATHACPMTRPRRRSPVEVRKALSFEPRHGSLSPRARDDDASHANCMSAAPLRFVAVSELHFEHCLPCLPAYPETHPMPESIIAQCPHCERAGTVSAEYKGKEIGCPRCARRFAAIPWCRQVGDPQLARDPAPVAPPPAASRFDPKPATTPLDQPISVTAAGLSASLLAVVVFSGAYFGNRQSAADALTIALLAVLGLAAVFVYFLPAIIAGHRNHNNYTAIIACNVLGGWTVIFWGVALIWALANPPQRLKQSHD